MPPPRPKDAVLDSDSDDEFVDASSEPPNFDPEEEAVQSPFPSSNPLSSYKTLRKANISLFANLQSLLAESNAIKTSANALYATARFSEAIGAYDRARAALPTHLAYEIAVLKSNAAACHVRLAEWRQAVEAASAALDGLERVLPSAGAARRRKKKERGRRREAEAGAKGRDEAVESRKAGNGHEGTVEMGAEGSEADEERERERESGQVVELDADDDDVAERELQRLRLGDERRAQVESLRAKSLLRRARGNAEQGGWGSLVAAEEGA